MSNEANTCREYVEPKLEAADWGRRADSPPFYTEQYYFTDGRIRPKNKRKPRGERKYADYLLCYTRDFPLAVVEAKRARKSPDHGLEQAKEYAEILGVKFAYSTNGKGIVEYDFTTGLQSEVMDSFPSSDELWQRLKDHEKLGDDVARKLLTPFSLSNQRVPRYYQRIAINRAVEAILKGDKRSLLTMATGTGKTSVAFQICWKLSNMGWNRTGEVRPPRILFLADRNVLVDDPILKDFNAFSEDKIHKIQGKANKSREIYFAIYQAIAKDKNRPGLYKEYSPGFFDLIIVDECHRGSSREESNWREILEYFQPAYQLGLTATPLRDDNVDTYEYFGNPLYIYSLKQGIEDGFLAPYRVHRISTKSDRDGWRPSAEDVERYGREIPDQYFLTGDFERKLVRKVRTWAIAGHITDFLKKTDRFAKTIVFCVDEDHVKEMRKALNNLNNDIAKDNPNYVCRITSDAGSVGKAHLFEFMDKQKQTHVIAVTSKLLTTGVDVPTCKNIVLARVIRSMTDFKQIIGRGTRVCEEYGKTSFTILDYTRSTVLFDDPEFDDEPDEIENEEINDQVQIFDVPENGSEVEPLDEEEEGEEERSGFRGIPEDEEELPSKLFVDTGHDEIVEEVVYELDVNTNRLVPSRLIDHTKEQVRTLYRSTLEIQQRWADPAQRNEIIDMLAERNIDFDELKAVTSQPDADPFDLLCHIAFGATVLTCRQRAEQLRRQKPDFFEQYGAEAREILETLLDKYAEDGIGQLKIPGAFKVNKEFEKYGNVSKIAQHFGGADQLREAFKQLQILLYTA